MYRKRTSVSDIGHRDIEIHVEDKEKYELKGEKNLQAGKNEEEKYVSQFLSYRPF